MIIYKFLNKVTSMEKTTNKITFEKSTQEQIDALNEEIKNFHKRNP